jgi:GNAT superfamily N-acetyltransferase
MEAKIRKVDTESKKDSWAVAKLEHGLKEEIYGKDTVRLEGTVEETEQEFESMASFNGRRDILLAEVGGEPVGYITYAQSDGRLEIDSFYVIPFFRGHGIGTAMIKQVLETAGFRYSEVKLLAPLKESRKIYERFGFKPYPRCGENCMLLHLDA